MGTNAGRLSKRVDVKRSFCPYPISWASTLTVSLNSYDFGITWNLSWEIRLGITPAFNLTPTTTTSGKSNFASCLLLFLSFAILVSLPPYVQPFPLAVTLLLRARDSPELNWYLPSPLQHAM